MTEIDFNPGDYRLTRDQKLILITRVLRILNLKEQESGRSGTWVVVAPDWQNPDDERVVRYPIESSLLNLPVDSIKRYERIPSSTEQRNRLFSVNTEFYPWDYTDRLHYCL
jgi:hypothetical protein